MSNSYLLKGQNSDARTVLQLNQRIPALMVHLTILSFFNFTIYYKNLINLFLFTVYLSAGYTLLCIFLSQWLSLLYNILNNLWIDSLCIREYQFPIQHVKHTTIFCFRPNWINLNFFFYFFIQIQKN